MGLIRVWQGFSKSLGKGLSIGLGKGCAKVEARFGHYFKGNIVQWSCCMGPSTGVWALGSGKDSGILVWAF